MAIFKQIADSDIFNSTIKRELIVTVSITITVRRPCHNVTLCIYICLEKRMVYKRPKNLHQRDTFISSALLLKFSDAAERHLTVANVPVHDLSPPFPESYERRLYVRRVSITKV